MIAWIEHPKVLEGILKNLKPMAILDDKANQQMRAPERIATLTFSLFERSLRRQFDSSLKAYIASPNNNR